MMIPGFTSPLAVCPSPWAQPWPTFRPQAGTLPSPLPSPPVAPGGGWDSWLPASGLRSPSGAWGAAGSVMALLAPWLPLMTMGLMAAESMGGQAGASLSTPFGAQGLGSFGAAGGGAVRQLLQDPRSLGPGAGMPMLPPDASQEQYQDVLQRRFGLPFEEVRRIYADGKQDLGYANRAGQFQRYGEVSPESLYKQIMVESQFGKIAFDADDRGRGGTGKLIGWGHDSSAVDLGRTESTDCTWKAYDELYRAQAERSQPLGGMMGLLGVGLLGPVGMVAAVFQGAQRGDGSDHLQQARLQWEQAVKSATPIVLDLAGDGIPPVEDGEWLPHPHSFRARNKQWFDIDADGVKELVEWVNPGGALLCRPNAQGDVPDGRHLFGDAGGFRDGYQKLATFDREGRGWLDLDDLEAAGIQVWIDETGDALVTEGELHTCRELGISRIHTTHEQWQSTFVQDGQEKKTWDWWPSYRKVSVGVR